MWTVCADSDRIQTPVRVSHAWTVWSNLGGGLVAPVENAVNLEAAECVQRILITEWPHSLTFISNPQGYLVQYT